MARHKQRPFVLAGDGQMDPSELLASGFPERIGAIICAPTEPPRGTATLDDFLVDRRLAAGVK